LKTLILGGIKSGKSAFAEHYILNRSAQKPYYLATTEFIDQEMQKKINQHKKNRADRFYTIEEPLKLKQTLLTLTDKFVLIECVSMWINNAIYHDYSNEAILEELQECINISTNIVFVLNDVSTTIVSDNPLVRRFVNLSGLAAQNLASQANEVYQVVAGIGVKIK